MNYYLFITGCQQNYYDAEKITHLFNEMGYFESEEKKANIIVAVACSVRQKPVDRIFGKMKIWKKLSQKPKIVIVGCVLPKDKNYFKSRVDAIIDSKDIEIKIANLLKIQKTKHQTKKIKNNLIEKKSNNAFVPIMFGCNNFCSYCAVPYTRGKEVSRTEKEIISEVKNNTKKGIDDIMLLGQNVNSYKPNFVKLLNKIEKIKDLKKISFMTSHPKDMSDALINWMSKSEKFSKELHLPMQSGDDVILKKMNRHYTAKHFLDLTNKIKRNVKLKYFSTDIIVGFPGETKKQFKNTFDLCKKIKFDKVFVSQYSPRTGTIAEKQKDNVSQAEKKRRWDLINKLINHL